MEPIGVIKMLLQEYRPAFLNRDSPRDRQKENIVFSRRVIIFWDVMPCSLFSCNRRSACHLLACWFLLKSFIRP
jgi:hypothetical protein